MATWTEVIVQALRNLGGRAHYSSLYDEVEKLRSGDLPASWQQQIRRAIEVHSSDSSSFAHGTDLFAAVDGLGNGVWELRDYTPDPTPVAPDTSELSETPGPAHIVTQVYRILRDTAMARSLKAIHKNRCQLCGQTLELGGGKLYSEVHHIRPLGNPHNGPDIPRNILVLCPNDHVRCDYGAIPLDLHHIATRPEHPIAQVFLDYHNSVIYKHATGGPEHHA